MSNNFDIVICLGNKDLNIINLMVNYTKNNIIGYRNIYIISYDKNIKIDGCITIDENIFPFNKQDIENHLCQYSYKSCWYLQQLLKFYALIVIECILDNILIIDSDTCFFKKTIFFEDNKPFYNYDIQNHLPYFQHMEKLHPSLKRQDINKSGISHHMVFQKNILLNLFKLIQDYHNKDFFQVFIESINPEDGNGASEYEIYFNFILYYYPNEIKIRKLNSDNRKRDFSLMNNNHDYDYISYHNYL